MRTVYWRVKKAKTYAIDTETFGPLCNWRKQKKGRIVDSLTAEMTGFSLSTGGESWYVPVGHVTGQNADVPSAKKFLAALMALDVVAWLHNAPYDIQVIRNFLGDPAARFSRHRDTKVVARHANMGVPVKKDGKTVYLHGLKDLTAYHFHHQMPTYAETVGNEVLVSGPTEEELQAYVASRQVELWDPKKGLLKKNQKLIDREVREKRKSQVWRQLQTHEISPEDLVGYAGSDAYWTFRLAELCWPKMEEWGYADTYDRVDGPLDYVLVGMYVRGILLDQEYIQGIKVDLQVQVRRLEQEWLELAQCSVNSPKQCAAALYETLKVWPIDEARRTGKGALSVAAEAVSHYKRILPPGSLGHRLAVIKEEHAELNKLLSAFTDSLLAQMPYRSDGRIRCSFNPEGTATGRFSCSDPNLNQLPAPDDNPNIPNIRKAFIARPGYKLVGRDWSQLEIVIIGHYSKDGAYCETILSGKSLHDIRAEFLGVKRSIAKTVGFGWQYGARAPKIALSLGLPVTEGITRDGRKYKKAPPEVVRYVDAFDELHEGLLEWKKGVVEECRKTGYVETILGRRRYVPEINSPNTLDRYHAERTASNTVIQGTAADICKLAMVEIQELWDSKGLDAHILLPVHDEIIAEVRTDQAEEAGRDMDRLMVSVVALDLPLSVDGAIGDSYADL